ncbi:hypothetical protein ACTA71_001722 [Dictyostelium dimigraforme]
MYKLLKNLTTTQVVPFSSKRKYRGFSRKTQSKKNVGIKEVDIKVGFQLFSICSLGKIFKKGRLSFKHQSRFNLIIQCWLDLFNTDITILLTTDKEMEMKFLDSTQSRPDGKYQFEDSLPLPPGDYCLMPYSDSLFSIDSTNDTIVTIKFCFTLITDQDAKTHQLVKL